MPNTLKYKELPTQVSATKRHNSSENRGTKWLNLAKLYRLTNPSNGNVGLSKSNFSPNAFGTGTSAAEKSTFGNALRKSGTPISVFVHGKSIVSEVELVL